MAPDDDTSLAGVSDDDLATAAIVVDDLLLKAAGASAETRFQSMELRLFKVLGRTFRVRALKAVEATSGLDGDTPATQADVNRIANRVASSFEGWERDVAADIKATVVEAYKLSKAQMADRINGKIDRIQPAGSPHRTAAMLKAEDDDDLAVVSSFSLVDRKAVDAMAKRQVVWIGDHYDENMQARVKELVRQNMLEDGLGRRDAGKKLRDALAREFGVADGRADSISLPPGWAGPPAQYFEGLAANTVTTARVHGGVRQMVEIGVTRYEVVNPDDERTCGRCRYMNGKIFEMRHAADAIDALADATHPEDVQAIHPWPKDEDMLKQADAEGLLGSLFPLPSYHFRCRCGVDMSEDAEINFIPAEPSPVEVKPAPKKPAPLSERDNLGEHLRDGSITARRSLKYDERGANRTEVVTIVRNGIPEDAIWKSVEGEADELRENIKAGTYYKREVAASKVAQQLGVAELMPVTVERKIAAEYGDKLLEKGSIQAFAREARATTGGLPLNRDAVERMRAFDFVTGNTDRHAGNVMWQTIKGEARPVMIDHGLCFPVGVPERFIQPKGYFHEGKLNKKTIDLIKGIDESKLARTLLEEGIEPQAVEETLYRTRLLKKSPKLLEYRGDGDDYRKRWEESAQKAKKKLKQSEVLEIQDLVAKEVSALQ